MTSDLLEFIDETLRNGAGRVCSSKLLTKQKSIERLARLCAKLNELVVDLTLNRVGGLCAQGSSLLFDGIMYKFGQSTRHQKFWQSARQVFAELKRINRRNIVDHLNSFLKVIENSGHTYSPSEPSVRYLGCLILERILRLDRLRVNCFRTADAAMGYIELRHHLTFNLMLIAIASDIAKEAADHIRHLSRTYNALADWLRLYSPKFPTSSCELPLISMRKEYLNPMRTQKLEEVRTIIRLLNLNELEDGLEHDDFDKRLLYVNQVLQTALRTADKPIKKGRSCRLIDRQQ